MRDDLVGHGRLVHDGVDLTHVEIGSRLAHLAEIFANPDVDHEGARAHEMARSDQFPHADLVRHVREYLAQPLAVTAVGCGGHSEDARHRIEVEDAINDATVAVGDRMMRLVDHEEIDRRHGIQICRPGKGRHHREGDLAIPVFTAGIDDRGRHAGINPGEFVPVLVCQFITVGQDTGLGSAVADHLARDRGQDNRLAGAGRSHTERVAVGVERRQAALDEKGLSGTKDHGVLLTVPRRGDRRLQVPRRTEAMQPPAWPRPIPSAPSTRGGPG